MEYRLRFSVQRCDAEKLRQADLHTKAREILHILKSNPFRHRRDLRSCEAT